MGLRNQAESDLGFILEDKTAGFGWDITLITPDETRANLIGFSDDISTIIDPDTGQIVSGRLASVALRLSSIYTALPGDGLPVGIAESGEKPWLIQFNDINGIAYCFKIAKTNPDRALGLITCLLEFYNND